MNPNKTSLLAISLLCLLGLNACDKKTPAEDAGKKIDTTVNQTSKAIDEAASKVEKKIDTQSAVVGQAVDDTEITTRVKAAIFAEPGLKSLQIGVDTVSGVVTLSGSVDSPTSSDKANALAAAVPGVKEVKNNLAMAPAK